MFVLEKQKQIGPWYRGTVFWNARLSFEAVFSALWTFFNGSSEYALFQNLVPEVYVQQLSLQAFINQKLLSLKKDASTSFLLVCSLVAGHRLPIQPTRIWTNLSIQRGQRSSEGTRLTSNKGSVLWTATLFATNMLSWVWRSEGPPADMPQIYKS